MSENPHVFVQFMHNGGGIYVSFSTEQETPFRSQEADELVTLDYDAESNLIGVEIAKPKARI